MILCFLIFSSAAGSDYTDISVSLTFLPGSVPGVQECTQIEIIDDQLVESNEAFTISLSSTDTEINLAPGNGSVTILDNDGTFSYSC